MQKVALVLSARIFPVQASSQPRGRMILVLGRSWHHVKKEDFSNRNKPDKNSGGSFSG